MIALAQPYLFIILSIISIAISADSRSFDEFKKNLISIRNFDILNGFNGIALKNWTQDEQCLKELNAIQNGLKNSEEWAFRSKCIELKSIKRLKCPFYLRFQLLTHGVNSLLESSITIFLISVHFRNVFTSTGWV